MTNKPDIEGMQARVAAATDEDWDNAAIIIRCNGKHAKDAEDRSARMEDFVIHARSDLLQLIKAYREQQECIRDLAEAITRVECKCVGGPFNFKCERCQLLKKWGLE